MSRTAAAVDAAFASSCRDARAPREGDTIVLAVSGGLDSTVLTHLARFGWPAGPRLVLAHFDHKMRPGSDGDARWLEALCGAWDLELVTGAAERPPSSEAEARAQRYAFLLEVRDTVGASYVATAHHADDQAETALFRIFRGTGPAGLTGVQTFRGDGVWRPLLPVWREELLGYARLHGLEWRDDPTNEALGYARNALRNRILPDAEALVAPGARRSLVRFAEQAAFDEEGWASLIPGLLASAAVVRTGDAIGFDRGAFLRHHAAVQARMFRALAAELNLTADARQTARAVDFVTAGASGRTLQLGRGIVLARELDRLVLSTVPTRALPADRAVVIPGATPGRGHALLAGREVQVSWAAGVAVDAPIVERFDGEALSYPLTVRAWEDGDRMRTGSGVRKLKRLFLEARVPASARRQLPVLADADGEILWVPRVARARIASVGSQRLQSGVLTVGVT
jgi:tRNA(Ile)-lysidine synthase